MSTERKTVYVLLGMVALAALLALAGASTVLWVPMIGAAVGGGGMILWQVVGRGGSPGD